MQKLAINNFVLITGSPIKGIRRAFKTWLDRNWEDLPIGLNFYLYEIEAEKIVLQADEKADNQIICSLVRFFYNSGDIFNKIEAYGYCLGKEIEALKNKRLKIYVPDKDEDVGSVFIVDQNNDSYKYDMVYPPEFHKTDETYSLPYINLRSEPEIYTFDKKYIWDKNKPSPTFFKLYYTAFAIIIYSFIALFINLDHSITIMAVLGFVVGKAFQNSLFTLRLNRAYAYSLLMASSFLLYITFLLIAHPHEIQKITYYFLFFPIPVIILNKPLRVIFVKVFGQEPEDFLKFFELENRDKIFHIALRLVVYGGPYLIVKYLI